MHSDVKHTDEKKTFIFLIKKKLLLEFRYGFTLYQVCYLHARNIQSIVKL